MTDIRESQDAWGGNSVAQKDMTIITPSARLWNKDRSGVVSTLRMGDLATLIAEDGNWRLIRGQHDAYLGWCEAQNLSDKLLNCNHIVTSNSALVFAEASIKAPYVDIIPMGAKLCSVMQVDGFAKLHDGRYISNHHLEPKVKTPAEWAQKLLGAPYIWGGGTHEGIDCSGLIQLGFQMVGKTLPRDSDQQENALPEITREELRESDLVFWPGHVGMMINGQEMVHATAYKMQVITENLDEAIARIGAPSSLRRVLD